MIKTRRIINLARVLVLVDKDDNGDGRTAVREPRRGEASGRRRRGRCRALDGRPRRTHGRRWRRREGRRPGVGEACDVRGFDFRGLGVVGRREEGARARRESCSRLALHLFPVVDATISRQIGQLVVDVADRRWEESERRRDGRGARDA